MLSEANRMIIDKIRSFIDNGWSYPEEEGPAQETDENVYIKRAAGRSSLFRTEKSAHVFNVIASVVLCVLLISLFLQMVCGLPYFGDADTLAENEVSEFYVENNLKDTGTLNIVTGIILSYRGFDTLGESHVLFIAVCSVMILLRSGPTDASASLAAYSYRDETEEPRDDVLLKGCSRVIVPLILMFGIYIILNGNLTPGGGFSGGSVLGAGLILYLTVYGYHRTRRFMNLTVFRAVSAGALVSYSILKGYHFVCGFNGWPSVFDNGTPGSIFSGGMLLYLNVYVGLVVACTMYTMFTLFRKGDF